MMAKVDFVYDNLGNIECGVTENGMKVRTDIPEYNVIVKDDSIDVMKAKQKVQRDQYNKIIILDDESDSSEEDIE